MRCSIVLMLVILVPASGPVAVLAAGTCSTPSFRPAPIYGVGAEPRGLAIGDLNGDGLSDIVTANNGGDSISVLLNDGTGSFTGPTNFPVGSSGPQAVAIADFNSDGKADLVTANVNNFTISLLLNIGGGSFAPPTNFNVNGQPFHLATGDFNNDGKADVVVAFGNSIGVLLGNGAGGFAASKNTNVGQATRYVAVGDFNGDTKLDVAVAINGNLQVMAGNGTGNFTFFAACIFVNAFWLAAADLNGDGKLDLVSSWGLNDQVSVHLNNGSACFTTTTFKASSRSGFHVGPVQVGDLNGDHKPDLLISSDFAGLSACLGDGAGNFGPPTSFSDGGITIFGLADFNSDGRLDAPALTSQNTVSIFFGDGQGGVLNVMRQYATGFVARDFNNDGFMDLAVLGGSVFVFFGDGSGNFKTPRIIPLTSISFGIDAGDFNNDGKLDLVTSNYTGTHYIAVILGDGAGNFAAPIQSVTDSEARAMRVGDFNGDGKLDVATANQSDRVSVMLGAGNGALGAPLGFSIPVFVNLSSFGTGDFNGDAKLDLAIPNFQGISILLGNGQGGFGPASTAASGIAAQAVVTGDVNGDGKLDLVLANYNSNEATLVAGNGTGSFGAPTSFAVSGRPQSLILGEFNGDGLVDVAVASLAPPPTGAGLSFVTVLLNDGAGGLAARADYPIPAPRSIVAADLNNDGRTDVATSSASGLLSILINSCTSTPPGPPTLQFSAPNYAVNEPAGSLVVTVTRTGDTSLASSVDYSTADGSASQKSDYSFAGGTLRFAPGDVSRTFRVLITDDLIPIEDAESLSVTLTNPVNATFGTPGSATINILDNDATYPSTNPLDSSDAQFFVRQHYYDFLGRQPDAGGLSYWTGQITQCGTDQVCLRNKRIDVSNAFFYELEYQQTGSYVYRLYRAAFGNNQPFPNPNPDPAHPGEENKVISYQAFVRDRVRVIGGAGLAQSQLDLANAFVLRPAFVARYPATMDVPAFVDALLATFNSDLGADLTSQRSALIDLCNSGGRGELLYRLADDNVQSNPINNRAFIDAEYNRAFVATQYYGYLRRNPDMAGFLFWLGQVNSAPLRDVAKQHAMVCSFITSTEYQQRFSPIATHSNADCQ